MYSITKQNQPEFIRVVGRNQGFCEHGLCLRIELKINKCEYNKVEYDSKAISWPISDKMAAICCDGVAQSD